MSGGSRTPGSRAGGKANRGSVMSMGTTGNYQESEVDNDFDIHDVSDAGSMDGLDQGRVKKLFKADGTLFRGQMMSTKVAIFVEELNVKCWRCIQEETGVVVSCADMWEQDTTMLRQILKLEHCSVSEIVLFRSMNEWAERQCRKLGLEPTNPEYRKEVLEPATIELLRFPTMTAEQFYWEVVPTGLLEYPDVQQLLVSMNQKGVVLGRFNTVPRINISLRKEKDVAHELRALGSLRTLTPADEKQGASAHGLPDGNTCGPMYNAVPGDPLDNMLGAGLLQSFLKRNVDEAITNDAFVMSNIEAQMAEAAQQRLPTIRAHTPLGTARPPSREALSPVKVLALSRESTRMVMGKLTDAEEGVQGVVARAGGRHSKPEDFLRLATGLYIFREERLLELWSEGGNAYAFDYGVVAGLDSIQPGEVEVAHLRKRFGLAESPPFGRGVPLTSFLCRQ